MCVYCSFQFIKHISTGLYVYGQHPCVLRKSVTGKKMYPHVAQIFCVTTGFYSQNCVKTGTIPQSCSQSFSQSLTTFQNTTANCTSMCDTVMKLYYLDTVYRFVTIFISRMSDVLIW